MPIEFLIPLSRHLVILAFLVASLLMLSASVESAHQNIDSLKENQATQQANQQATNSVEGRVKRVIIERMKKEGVINNTNVTFKDLGFDSLDQVELIIALEEEFKGKISDEDAAKIGTVQQAIDYINGRYKK